MITKDQKTKLHCIIGIKHGFSCINIRKVSREVLKPRPVAAVFNTSLGTWRMLMHWKTMFDRYYCIKTENICYILRYFLHYFVLPFHRCLANAISTDYARSRAGQYTSRNGSKSVAPVLSYWKLRSRALTARELSIHGFSPVNARLLITCDIAFYAIIYIEGWGKFLRLSHGLTPASIPRCFSLSSHDG